MTASTALKTLTAAALLVLASAHGYYVEYPVKATHPPMTTARHTTRPPSTRPVCMKEGAYCKKDRDCCDKGRFLCTPTPWEGRGKRQCLKAPPKCYGVDRRCMGAPGHPYIPYAPCCDTRNSCVPDSKLGWGGFCKKPVRRSKGGEYTKPTYTKPTYTKPTYTDDEDDKEVVPSPEPTMEPKYPTYKEPIVVTAY